MVASKDYETALAESAENAYIYFPTDRNTVVFNARNMGGAKAVRAGLTDKFLWPEPMRRKR